LGFRGRLNGVEMRRKHDALAGIGLMQSPEEWAARGGHLAATLAALIRDHAANRSGSATRTVRVCGRHRMTRTRSCTSSGMHTTTLDAAFRVKTFSAVARRM
jgi:hypothetical protein